MKEYPILFSAPMVRAILCGDKTQTRRVCKSAAWAGSWADAIYPARESGWVAWKGAITPGKPMADEAKRRYAHGFPCPYGQAGDRLWVRETHRIVRVGEVGYWAEYRADSANLKLPNNDLAHLAKNDDKWRPSIFMPRAASRITLELTGVRVERVQGISEADARAEGVGSAAEYAALWDSLNAKRGYAWAANPWVWVLEFRRVL